MLTIQLIFPQTLANCVVAPLFPSASKQPILHSSIGRIACIWLLFIQFICIFLNE